MITDKEHNDDSNSETILEARVLSDEDRRRVLESEELNAEDSLLSLLARKSKVLSIGVPYCILGLWAAGCVPIKNL